MSQKKNSPEFDLCFRLIEDLSRNAHQWTENSYGICRVKGKEKEAKIVLLVRIESESVGIIPKIKKIKKAYLTCPVVYTFDEPQANELYDAVTAWRVKTTDKTLAEMISFEILEGGSCSSVPPLQSSS